MRDRKQNWVIYKISRKGYVVYDTVNCIKPNLTKFYKQCKKDMYSDMWVEIGYMTEKELFNNNLWVNPTNKIEVYIGL